MGKQGVEGQKYSRHSIRKLYRLINIIGRCNYLESTSVTIALIEISDFNDIHTRWRPS